MTFKKIIGLTGGIGSGKSVAANYLSNMGAYVIDADIIAHKVIEPGTPTYLAIIDLLGNGYINPDQSINRTKIRKLIFNNPEIKKSYESIILPAIRKKIIEMIQNPPNKCCYTLLVAPLLFEKGLANYADKSIVIDTDEKTQIKRVLARDSTKDKSLIKKIIATQLPRSKRNSLADYVISNQGDLDQLKEQLKIIHNTIIV